VLAAAGLKRLGIDPPHRIDLPTDRFVPSPAQGALAVQTRVNAAAAEIVRVLDDDASRRAVNAERTFLLAIGAGCHTPVGALATIHGAKVSVHGQLFSDDHRHVVEGVEAGEDSETAGRRLALRLIGELKKRP
jgi:hydroxymethylbilane synthase